MENIIFVADTSHVAKLKPLYERREEYNKQDRISCSHTFGLLCLGKEEIESQQKRGLGSTKCNKLTFFSLK